MAAHKRTIGEIEKDEIVISNLYLKGYSYRAIAKVLREDTERTYSLSHVQIGEDIKKMLSEWKTVREENIEEWVGIELEKIATLEVEYWEAWEKSKEDYEKRRTKSGTNYLGASEEESLESMKMYGDPRFLAGIERCIQKRCDLLGLDKPKELTIKTALDMTQFSFESHPLMVVAK